MYLRIVVLLNFLVDFLLLMGTDRLSGFPAAYKRYFIAALLGGMYSGVCLLRGFYFLGKIFWRLVILMLMATISFGWNRSVVKRSGVFILLSMALGGIATLIGRQDTVSLVLAAVVLWGLTILSFGESVGGREYLPVEIAGGLQTIHLIALRDTGNMLHDPISGEQVLVIGNREASRLTGLSEQQISAPVETLSQKVLPGLRLIPYHSVGKENDLLLAKRYQHVKINGIERSVLVAFAPGGLGGEVFQALTGRA